MPSQIFLMITGIASAPKDSIRNSAPLYINKRQPGKTHNLPPQYYL